MAGHHTTRTTSRRRPVLLGVAAVVMAGGISYVVITQRGDTFNDAAERFQSEVPASTDTCCDTVALTLGRDGRPMTRTQIFAFGHLMNDLGFEFSVIERIRATRALDEMQTAESDRATAWWTFHPDNGLHVILESK